MKVCSTIFLVCHLLHPPRASDYKPFLRFTDGALKISSKDSMEEDSFISTVKAAEGIVLVGVKGV